MIFEVTQKKKKQSCNQSDSFFDETGTVRGLGHVWEQLGILRIPHSGKLRI